MSKVFRITPKRAKRSNGQGVDTRYGYNGDNTLKYHHSILQWSRRDKRAVHAHVWFRLQEGLLFS